MNCKEVCILGAGPTGIGSALVLKDKAVLLERRNQVGGLCRSFQFDGATFDLGGHSFHTPHEDIRKLVYKSLNMYDQVRDARCLTYGSLIPYPFQKNFHLIKNPKVVKECETSMVMSKDLNSAKTFEDFLIRRFGLGISKHFMLPYNRKLWGDELKGMDSNWVSERVAAPKGVDEKFDLKSGTRNPLQSDTKVGYPSIGGFQEIFKALANDVSDLRLNQEVTFIDPIKKELKTSSNDIYSWNKLITTIPIHDLLNMIEGVPDEIIGIASRLKYLSLKVACIAIKYPVNTEIQRIYSAEPHIAAHKTAINHNSSYYLRAQSHHGIMAEISFGLNKKMIRMDLNEWIIDNLIEMNLIKNQSDIITVKIYDVKYAYPIPVLGHQSILNRIKVWLEQNEIYSIGRFGEWAYINSDEALYRGIRLGKSLLNEIN